jgi:ATP-dependent DNA helicase RecG
MLLAVQRAELVELITRLQAGLGEMQVTEAKRARREVPADLSETLSAFSNTAEGGVILLGIDERSGFSVTGVEDLPRVAERVVQVCRDEMEPSLAPLVSSEDVDGQHVLVVEVPELTPAQKPAYVKSRGLVNGAFLRVGGTNRRLTNYETSVLLANRGQPRDDQAIVLDASRDDLDADLVAMLVGRVRQRRGPSFGGVDDATVLRRLGVLGADGRPTLAGLLALGSYPQQFFPQLDITFAFYGRGDREPLADGTRFLDSSSFDGPMPVILEQALQRIRINMRHRAVIHGAGRTDIPDYPEAALREALANALMHRDYSGPAQGTQIRVEMFPDRIEIESPGGLYGPVSTEALQAGDPVSSSRNASLAKLLEDVVGPDGQAIAENRGSGVVTMQRALRDAQLAPPEFEDQVRRFIVRFSNATLVDDDTRAWIASLEQRNLSDRQVAALALARRDVSLTNARYRALTGCDAAVATRDLGDLRDRGLMIRAGSASRRATWTLAPEYRRDRSSDRAELPGRLTAEGRRNQIRRLLELGDRSSSELVDATGLSKPSVLNYLNDLRKAGEVEPTSAKIKSPATRWRLTDVAAGQLRLPTPPPA